MARENPAQILSIETNDEPSEAISTHIPRNAKGRIRQGTRPNSRMYWWPRTAPVGTNWRAGCEKSQHSGRQHRSAKPHHGFKSGARNEQCRPTCTWWPHEANRVVLLGISLGGVFAPALAREKAVRGIVVFGTLAKRPPAYPGRSERFFTEFDAVDVPAAWAAIDTRLLMQHGPGDLGIERRGPGFPADARLSSIVRRFLLCVVSAFRRT